MSLNVLKSQMSLIQDETHKKLTKPTNSQLPLGQNGDIPYNVSYNTQI